MLKFIDTHWRLLSVLLLGGITLSSLIPLSQLPNVAGGDKSHHLIAYAILVFPLALCRPPKWIGLVCVYAIWGGIIELLQPFVNRYAEWFDVVANCAGLGLGIFVAFLVKKMSK